MQDPESLFRQAKERVAELHAIADRRRRLPPGRWSSLRAAWKKAVEAVLGRHCGGIDG